MDWDALDDMWLFHEAGWDNLDGSNKCPRCKGKKIDRKKERRVKKKCLFGSTYETVTVCKCRKCGHSWIPGR